MDAAMLESWKTEIRDVLASTWLGKIRVPPILIVKRGYLSPWFLPWLWGVRSGAFSFFPFVIISTDLLRDFKPEHRRAVAAHEVGHMVGLHNLIWIGYAWLLISIKWHHVLFMPAGSLFGPHAPGMAFLGFLVLAMWGAARLQRWFEHFADDFAMRKVGRTDYLATLEWVKQRVFGNKPAPWLEERLARLRSR